MQVLLPLLKSDEACPPQSFEKRIATTRRKQRTLERHTSCNLIFLDRRNSLKNIVVRHRSLLNLAGLVHYQATCTPALLICHFIAHRAGLNLIVLLTPHVLLTYCRNLASRTMHLKFQCAQAGDPRIGFP
jgi:hypothetical protein